MVLDDRTSREVQALAGRLPEPLAPLARVAFDLRWSWKPGGAELFAAVDAERWEEVGRNPVALLTDASPEALELAARDDELVGRLRAFTEQLDAESPPDGPPVAYLCAEFAVHRSLPIYSGGLGALAGDVLKAASDAGQPMVGVGLFYTQGYFRQRVDHTGWQQESWTALDRRRMPLSLLRGDDGEALTATVPIAGREIVVRAWLVRVGRVALVLLDTDCPENDPFARWLTARLYVGQPELRLWQYVLLGVGGMRMLRAAGVEPAVVHLNEGHAAFAALEVGNDPSRTVFTTHTPVPAGNDTYAADDVRAALGALTDDPEGLLARGRTHPEAHHEPFGVTQFALRTSRAANGVSRRHGEVARAMWHELWPDRAREDVPIGHVTNGVHAPTWVGAAMRELLERHVGEDWWRRAGDDDGWQGFAAVGDDELWDARCRQRTELVAWAGRRALADRLGRGDPPAMAESALRGLDPGALTIGFARRLATYKRLHLLGRDADRLIGLLRDHPVQLLLAGKAHPRDEEAKRTLQAIFGRRHAREVQERVVWLDDYDLDVACRLVQGCDVWLNLPRPPLEASGTSGMKAALNGGLNLSVLDGWWAEAHDGTSGWGLSGDIDHDHEAQDHRHAQELAHVLEHQVLPAWHDRGAWLQMVRAAVANVGPRFSAARMLRDYQDRMYAVPR